MFIAICLSFRVFTNKYTVKNKTDFTLKCLIFIHFSQMYLKKTYLKLAEEYFKVVKRNKFCPRLNFVPQFVFAENA